MYAIFQYRFPPIKIVLKASFNTQRFPKQEENQLVVQPELYINCGKSYLLQPLQLLYLILLRIMTSLYSVVDTTASVSELIDSIVNLPTDPPSLFFDLEGIELSRNGTIFILQLLVNPSNHVYLIDIHLLRGSAFTTPGSQGKTLQDVLQSPATPKVCFDVRNDSDALYAHFGVALQGIQDIQLMENASRRPSAKKNFLNGLARCIQYDAPIPYQDKQSWNAIKDQGLRLFAPERGGSYEVFNERPLKEELSAYCVQDVRFLPHLRNTYWGRLSLFWQGKVEEETLKRVLDSHSANYQPHGTHKSLGPWQS